MLNRKKERLSELENDSYFSSRLYYRTLKEHGLKEEPPKPPKREMKEGLFGEYETKESQERYSKYIGKLKAYYETY